MKKTWQRGLIISLSTMMLLSGCGSKSKTTENTESATEFSYWVRMPSAIVSTYQTMGELPMYQELAKRTGITINFVHPTSGQESEQFNLMIASEELPDMIEYGWRSYSGGPEKAISDNVIISLNDLLKDNAPNLTAALKSKDDYDRQSKTNSGQYYGFPSLNTDTKRAFGGLILRKDWLQDLNLPVPETIDEWETVLRAFKEQKGAVTPFTCNLSILSHKSSYINPFNNAFDVGKGFYMENKKVKFGPIEPGYKDYIATMSKWYQEGLLDNDYDTNNSNAISSKVITGKAGACFGYVGSTLGRYLPAAQQDNPDFDLVAVAYPVKNKGDDPKFTNATPEVNDGAVAITTACKDPVGATKWADYMYSEDGKILKNFGIEGVTYTKEGDQYIYTDEITNNSKGLSLFEAMMTNFRAAEPGPGFCQLDGYLDQYYQMPQQKEAIVIWNEHLENSYKYMLPPVTISSEHSAEMANLAAEIDTYIEEMLLKFIQGTVPMDQYDQFVETCHQMNIDRLIEIYQEALDAYYNR